MAVNDFSSQKMVITAREALIKHLQDIDPTKLKINKPSLATKEFEIRRKTFKGYTFTKEFSDLLVKGCKFVECTFENIWGFYWLFEKCKFIKCEFKNSRFSHLEFDWAELQFIDCRFRNVQWDEGALFNIYFERCHFFSFTMMGMVPISYVVFTKCSFENTQFQSIVYYKEDTDIDDEVEDLIFDECMMDYCYFNGVDLRNSFFVDTSIYKSAFIDCEFRPTTIVESEGNNSSNYASIDFQSILKSDGFDHKILEKYFNIHDPEIKNIAKSITSKINFKTVFISYSFKDKSFAGQLNDALTQRGIKTFLWEKDARSGQPLEDIMSTNARKHDRILFIASENSIKSKACQLELSEGRIKQESTWDTVLFPIHIDNFLFTVRKSQIRPIAKADEYWENIEELKRINSTDFSQFAGSDFDQSQFDDAIAKIIKELKLD